MSSESKSAPTPARSTSPADDAASAKGSVKGSVNGSAPASANGSVHDGNGGGANGANATTMAPAAVRPPLRNNFELEPNPFEQSFSTSHSSTSLTSHATEKDDKRSTSPKPLLPPLAAITSSETSFGWSTGLNSLRAGPLSPAMLTGPQQGSTGLTPFTSDHHSAFGRTGLTPGTGLTPLIGGPSSFPPPSPNTAAFLAMVTNGTSAAVMSSAVSATITPNTLAAITGVIQSNLPASNHGPHPLSVSHVPPQTFDPTNQRPSSSESSTSYFQQQPHHQQQQQPQANGDMYAASAGSAAANAANALYLLSQQHKEITDRAEAGGGVQAKRGSKRKSMDGPPSSPPAGRSKKPRVVKGRSRSKKDDSPDFSDDDSLDDIPDPAPRSSKKPETEEEKRKNFLERNRQAALKCRQRKKAWLAQLQQKVEFLAAENERLTSALVGSREEIARLNSLVVQAGGQPNPNPNANQSIVPPNQSGGPVSVPVSMPASVPPPLGKSQSHISLSISQQHHSHHHLASQPASVSVGGGGSSQRGYGY